MTRRIRKIDNSTSSDEAINYQTGNETEELEQDLDFDEELLEQEKPWQSEKLLRQLHYGNGMSQQEIADFLGTKKMVVAMNMGEKDVSI
ncbi:hypothetical protein [Natrinema sp. 74]|uniref:hypothetical protein n=1 Tax=Natrinema sp. 74 TaxID=3384159 RepID=UPI0038D3896F